MKKKEPVKLRQRELANGNHTLYLDIYWKGQREYEYLNLYVKKSNKTADNEQNRQTLILADQIRAQRVIDLQSGKYKLKQPKTQISFLEYFNKLKTDRLNSKGNFGNWDSAYKHLLKFMNGKNITLGEVAESWLIAFKQYLLQDAKIAGGNIKLSQNSALSYFNKVKAALRQAFEEKLIQENPAVRVRSIKPAETKREFLTWEEVQKISTTKCIPTNAERKAIYLDPLINAIKDGFTNVICLDGCVYKKDESITSSQQAGKSKQEIIDNLNT